MAANRATPLKFPDYPHHLSPCLNPFRFADYARLAYWVYFCPTALKSYLYRAVPGLFDQAHPIGFFRKWGAPAFRNLFIMMPVICAVISIIGGGATTLFCAWKLHAPVTLAEWPDSALLGIALGMTLGMAFGMVGRVIGGAALSALVGIMYGMTVGVVGGISFTAVFGLTFQNVMDGVLTVSAIAAVFGGMAFTLDIEIGIALSLAFAVIALLSFGSEALMLRLFHLRFGALAVRGVMSAAFVFGAFRVALYPIEFACAVASLCYPSLHPIFWDELTVLPLPFTRRVLLNRLRENEADGLQRLRELGRNFFRRAALNAVLYRYIHRHETPLRFLYALFHHPAMNEYALIPVTSRDWDDLASARYLLFGELALRPVDAAKHPRFSRSVWWLNLFRPQATALTRFAGMLYDLAHLPRDGQDALDLAAYRSIFSGVRSFRDGDEIASSFDAITRFLSFRGLADLPAADQIGHDLSVRFFFPDAIRPPVLHALMRLGKVGAAIGKMMSAADQQARFAALADAANDLSDIERYVNDEAKPPELALLQRILAQWQHMILSELGRLGHVGATDAAPDGDSYAI